MTYCYCCHNTTIMWYKDQHKVGIMHHCIS